MAYPEWIYTGFGLLSGGIGLGLAAWVVRRIYSSLSLPADEAATVGRVEGSTPPRRNGPRFAMWGRPVNPGGTMSALSTSGRDAIVPPWTLRRTIPDGGLLLLWLALLIYSWLRFMEIAPAAQGRYFFPAASTLGLIFVLACRGFGHRLGASIGWGIVAALTVLSVVTPFVVIRPTYAAPHLQNAAPMQALSTFGAGVAQVAILAVDASPAQLRPGDEATVRVTWQALAPLPKDYSVFVHLVDADGFTVAQRDTMPLGGRAPTSRWQPGQIIEDRYVVEIPPTAYTPTHAQWAVGLYDHSSGERLPLHEDGDAFVFGSVDLQTPLSSYPGVPNPVNVDFADGVTLVGYRLSERRLAPGDELTVTLFWRARTPVSQDYTPFVHILDGGFTMHGGHDGAPQIASSVWHEQADDIIVDVHTFVVSPDAPSGDYQLEVGLYPWPSFARLRLLDTEGAEGADRLLLGPLRLTPHADD